MSFNGGAGSAADEEVLPGSGYASAQGPSGGIDVDGIWQIDESAERAFAGLITPAEADAIAHRLRTGTDPGRAAPEAPWAILVRRPDGSFVATASTLVRHGLIYTCTASGPLVVALDPRSAAVGAGQSTQLDPDFVRGIALMKLQPEATALQAVRRLACGSTLIWSPDRQVQISHWLGPADSANIAEPHLRGPQAQREYLASFDGAVDQLASRSGPISAELSGGLDSSFLVATLALRTGGDSAVAAFTHAPVEAAIGHIRPPGVSPGWIVDDTSDATRVAERYAGRVEITEVRNTAGLLGLDAAALHSRRTWLPLLSPTNEIWISRIRELARQRGSTMIFSGVTGNASFSHGHPYAVGHHLRQRQAWRALRAATWAHAGGQPWRHILRAASREPAPSQGLSDELRDRFGLPRESPLPDGGLNPRQRYLRWLLGQTGHFAGNSSPLGSHGLYQADPFTARAVLETAAAIEPGEWLRGPHPRGLARTLAAGRVPDAVRLRRARGEQAADTWWHMRFQRQRYHDEVDLLAGTPILGGWIKQQAIRDLVEDWPWGEPVGPAKLDLLTVERLLALAAYVREMAIVLADSQIPSSHSSSS